MLQWLPTQDPGNLESDLQTGAKTGYVLLWLMLATTVLVSHFALLLRRTKLNAAMCDLCIAVSSTLLNPITHTPRTLPLPVMPHLSFFLVLLMPPSSLHSRSRVFWFSCRVQSWAWRRASTWRNTVASSTHWGQGCCSGSWQRWQSLAVVSGGRGSQDFEQQHLAMLQYLRR